MLPIEGKLVLVVDDEPDLRDILKYQLESQGAEVHGAENGNQAWEKIQNEEYDLVITDIRMSNGDGLELLQRVQSQTKKSPLVILITGFSDINQENALKRGAVALFFKPFDLETLSITINSLLKSK